MSTEHSLSHRGLETRVVFTLTRVLIDANGYGVAPSRTTVKPEVIFVRTDGWSLGAPKELESAAREMWKGDWVESWRLRDGRWEKTWPLPPD